MRALVAVSSDESSVFCLGATVADNAGCEDIDELMQDFYAKPWHVMSDASGQQIFPSAGKQTFYLGGGSTTTPIFPFEKSAAGLRAFPVVACCSLL